MHTQVIAVYLVIFDFYLIAAVVCLKSKSKKKIESIDTKLRQEDEIFQV